MPERRIIWGPDSATAKYRTGDTEGDTNFVVVEDTDAGTVLLEWDESVGEWVNRGPVNFDGNDVTNVGSVSTDQVTNTSLNPPRDLYQATSKTVTVDPAGGADYASVQTAVDNELTNLKSGVLTLDLAADTYNEDVTITGVHGDRGIGSTAVTVSGDTATPSNVTGLSFAVKNCTARVDVSGVEITREHPFSAENTGLIAYESTEVRVANSLFGAITNGVTSYNALCEIAEVDFGANLSVAERVKHEGEIFEQTINASDITGSVGTAYKVISGTIKERTDNTLSATDRYDIRNGCVVDETGRMRGEIDVTAGQTETRLHYSWGSDLFSAQNVKKTNDVSTSAKGIIDLQNEEGAVARTGRVTVTGSTSDANTTFIDEVLVTRNGSTTVIGSEGVGSPPSRSYSVTGSTLELTMGSGTFDVIADATAMRAV